MTTDDPAVPYGYPRSLRTPRVYHAMLWRALLSTPAELARYAITIRGVVFTVPAAVEEARTEGWCRLEPRGYGEAAPAIALPLNLRDDAGAAVGEVMAMDNRGGDLWGLALWRRESEDMEAWASRVRMAGLMRDVPVLLWGGAAGEADEASEQAALRAGIEDAYAEERANVDFLPEEAP